MKCIQTQLQGMKLVVAPMVLITGLLSGCASISPATQSETLASASQSLPPIPPGWTSARERIGDVNVGWIEEFDDPLLTQLVNEALLSNRNLRAAAANVRRSWALARQAASPLLPSISGSGSAQRNEPFENGGSSTFFIILSVCLFISIFTYITITIKRVLDEALAEKKDDNEFKLDFNEEEEESGLLEED